MTGSRRDDIEVADYVLGLMEPKEAAFFERDMRLDPVLAARVEDWRRRVAELAGDKPETPQGAMRGVIAAAFPPVRVPRQGALRPAAARRAFLGLAGAAAAILAWLLLSGPP